MDVIKTHGADDFNFYQILNSYLVERYSDENKTKSNILTKYTLLQFYGKYVGGKKYHQFGQHTFLKSFSSLIFSKLVTKRTRTKAKKFFNVQNIDDKNFEGFKNKEHFIQYLDFVSDNRGNIQLTHFHHLAGRIDPNTMKVILGDESADTNGLTPDEYMARFRNRNLYKMFKDVSTSTDEMKEKFLRKSAGMLRRHNYIKAPSSEFDMEREYTSLDGVTACKTLQKVAYIPIKKKKGSNLLESAKIAHIRTILANSTFIFKGETLHSSTTLKTIAHKCSLPYETILRASDNLSKETNHILIDKESYDMFDRSNKNLSLNDNAYASIRKFRLASSIELEAVGTYDSEKKTKKSMDDIKLFQHSSVEEDSGKYIYTRIMPSTLLGHNSFKYRTYFREGESKKDDKGVKHFTYSSKMGTDRWGKRRKIMNHVTSVRYRDNRKNKIRRKRGNDKKGIEEALVTKDVTICRRGDMYHCGRYTPVIEHKEMTNIVTGEKSWKNTFKALNITVNTKYSTDQFENKEHGNIRPDSRTKVISSETSIRPEANQSVIPVIARSVNESIQKFKVTKDIQSILLMCSRVQSFYDPKSKKYNYSKLVDDNPLHNNDISEQLGSKHSSMIDCKTTLSWDAIESKIYLYQYTLKDIQELTLSMSRGMTSIDRRFKTYNNNVTTTFKWYSRYITYIAKGLRDSLSESDIEKYDKRKSKLPIEDLFRLYSGSYFKQSSVPSFHQFIFEHNSNIDNRRFESMRKANDDREVAKVA